MPRAWLPPIAHHDRGDQSAGDCTKDELVALPAPFIAARWLAEVVLPIVHAWRIIPIIIAHALATLPAMLPAPILAPASVATVVRVTAISILPVVVFARLRDGRRACQKGDSDRPARYRFHGCFQSTQGVRRRARQIICCDQPKTAAAAKWFRPRYRISATIECPVWMAPDRTFAQ